MSNVREAIYIATKAMQEELDKATKVNSKKAELERRFAEVSKADASTMIQINMSTTVFSIPQCLAMEILKNAIEDESQYERIIFDRLCNCLRLIRGESQS